jgi:hypothetical protein
MLAAANHTDVIEETQENLSEEVDRDRVSVIYKSLSIEPDVYKSCQF